MTQPSREAAPAFDARAEAADLSEYVSMFGLNGKRKLIEALERAYAAGQSKVADQYQELRTVGIEVQAGMFEAEQLARVTAELRELNAEIKSRYEVMSLKDETLPTAWAYGWCANQLDALIAKLAPEGGK